MCFHTDLGRREGKPINSDGQNHAAYFDETAFYALIESKENLRHNNEEIPLIFGALFGDHPLFLAFCALFMGG